MKKLPVTLHERTLKNGMKVVIVHKPDYVKSLFMLGIPAGGTSLYYEQNGQVSRFPSGCAHFLEHQMFRLHGEDVTPLLASMQAQSNAFTDFTQTCYYVMTAAKPWGPLKTLIEFVQTLDITDQSVQKERGIILSEYDMYASSPDSRIMT
ncbi:MAG: insulinase family protein, partial [Erysipelotrichaceae bacterium]|nr:insulinase family protein [Erysipelotrichaceae bacterium]